MRFRKLRIAWSVFWGVACVLLICLWVRSYWRADGCGNLDKSLIATTIGSNRGELYFSKLDWKLDVGAGHSASHGWRYQASQPFVPDQSRCLSLVNRAGFFRLGIAHWLVVLTTIAFAAAPWPRWRFKLRTLLIATTLIAVVLGVAVSAASK